MRIFVIGALASLAACGGQSPKACTTDCAMVGGNYDIILAAGYATCGNETLTFSGGQGTGRLDQDGSALTLTLGSTVLQGTLHTDHSALFGPSSDTSVSNDGSSPNQAGSSYLAGFFTTSTNGSTGFNFDGTYFFIEGDNGCEVDSKSTWR